MTRERLQSLPLEELRRFAERQSIEFDSAVDKDSLVNLLVEAFEELAEEREQQSSFETKVEAKKFDSPDSEIESESCEYPAIPEFYNDTRVVVLPRDPAWAFAYWEIRQDKLTQLRRDRDVRLVLRVHDVEGPHFNGKSSRSSFDIPIKLTDSRWYINLPRAGGHFVLELLYRKKGKEHQLAHSNVFETPPESFSERVDPAWRSDKGEVLLGMSLHRSVGEIPGSGTIPQRILSVS